MSRPARPLPVALALAACLFVLAGCGGSDSDGAGSGAEASAADGASTTTEAEGVDGCPDTTTYAITGPDGEQTFTAASAYARETGGYLSLFLFSRAVDEDEVASIDTGFRTDDPGTIFASLHPRGTTSQPVTPVPEGTYEADSVEAQKTLEAGNWITTVSASLGLEQVASGFPVDPETTIELTHIDEDLVCGTISHPAATATFAAVHLVTS